MGRPSKYTHNLAKEICEWIASGKSLRRYCEQDKKPSKSTVLAWLLDEQFKAFSDQYALARRLQAEGYEDECIDISDDGANDTYVDKQGNTRTDWDVLGRSKLRIDTRKWTIERMASKRPAETDNAPVQMIFEVSAEPERYRTEPAKDEASD